MTLSRVFVTSDFSMVCAGRLEWFLKSLAMCNCASRAFCTSARWGRVLGYNSLELIWIETVWIFVDWDMPPAVTSVGEGRNAENINIEAMIAMVSQNSLYPGSFRRLLPPKRDATARKSAEGSVGLILDCVAEGTGDRAADGIVHS